MISVACVQSIDNQINENILGKDLEPLKETTIWIDQLETNQLKISEMTILMIKWHKMSLDTTIMLFFFSNECPLYNSIKIFGREKIAFKKKNGFYELFPNVENMYFLNLFDGNYS